MRDRGWMALMEKALIDVAFFLASEKERSVRVKRARSLAGWLAGCLLRRLRRNEATLLSRKTKEQRAAVAHPPSPFFHLLLKRPGCLSFSYYQAGSSPPPCPSISCSGPPVIINENRVYRPSSK